MQFIVDALTARGCSVRRSDHHLNHSISFLYFLSLFIAFLTLFLALSGNIFHDAFSLPHTSPTVKEQSKKEELISKNIFMALPLWFGAAVIQTAILHSFCLKGFNIHPSSLLEQGHKKKELRPKAETYGFCH